jgi:hypoxanthine phosphoribosyltransferase
MTGENRHYINTLEITWTDFEFYINQLVGQIKHSKIKISNIYGVPRGGLVIAVRLSHLLQKPLIGDWAEHDEHTLIVDDCVDTGQTLASPACDGIKIAALLYCPNASFKPTFFAGLKSKTTWCIFPWEKTAQCIVASDL